MHIAPVVLAALAATILLSACTHDYDVFKPRRDAGTDGSSNTSRLDTEDTNDVLEDTEED